MLFSIGKSLEYGYNMEGYNREGYDREGYNMEGYNMEGYNRKGYNREGYDREGYNSEGYNREGYDSEGYNMEGYNSEGYNREGYDSEGYNREGYDSEGYNREGYNREGYDMKGHRIKFLNGPATWTYNEHIDPLWACFTDCIAKCYSTELNQGNVGYPCYPWRLGKCTSDKNLEKKIIYKALKMFYEKCEEVLGEDVKDWDERSRANLLIELMCEALRLPLQAQNIYVVKCIFHYMQLKFQEASYIRADWRDPSCLDTHVDDLIEKSSYLNKIVSLLQEQDQNEEGPKKRMEAQEQERQKEERYRRWAEEDMRMRYG